MDDWESAFHKQMRAMDLVERNLTKTQERCTELMVENRDLKNKVLVLEALANDMLAICARLDFWLKEARKEKK